MRIKANGMNPDWQRIKQVLAEAAARQSPAERAAYLDGACRGDASLRAQIEKLLRAHDRAGAFLEAPALEPPEMAAGLSVALSEKSGDKIGRYKLLQQIGEGGCGVVYMAEQEQPIHRRVALKIIKLGMDTKAVIARFEAERQALALMDHPNIARVLDAGATETGRPYFVMELVRGIKITDYCDQNQLSPEARLNLFVQVCHALQHAHQKGIIHRDIKPSNILVTMQDGVPVPKVIDFGIAKATDRRLTDKTLFTAFEQFIGTPAYMSPEQAQMSTLDIDTRSDIYALGVLLYELLTGHTPFEQQELVAAGLDGMRRIIREQEPQRPSTRLSTLAAADQTTVAKCRQLQPPQLIHLVRGDLDWIVMRCLEKDRARRFQSANSLAEDVVRYLANEPITARPPNKLYRLEKLVRRNKATFAAGALVTLALVLGLGFSLWTLAKERAARRQALTAEKESQAEALKARRNLYAADMAAAQRELTEGNRGTARGLLDTHRPVGGEEDLRGFEWRCLWQQSHGDQLWTFRGHSNSISGVAYSPDGRVLASASADGIVRLWDVPNRQPLAVLSNSVPGFAAVAFAPQGNLLGATSSKGVRLWDLSTLRVVQDIPTPRPALPLAFVPGRAWLAVGMGDPFSAGHGGGNTVLYDVATGQELRTLPESGGRTLALSADGTRLATGPFEKKIKLWDPTTGAELATIPGVGRLISLALSPDGRRLAASDWYGQVSWWDLGMAQAKKAFAGHETIVFSIAFSPNGRSLATGSADQTVRLWDVATCGEQVRLLGHGHEVWSVAFSPDGEAIASGSHDETVLLWSATPKPETSFALGTAQRDQRVPFAVFSPDGQLIAARTPTNSITVWEVDSGTQFGRFLNTSNWVLRFVEGGRTLATIHAKGPLDLWDLRNQQHRQVMRNGLAFGPPRIDLSSDGTLLAENGTEGRVLLRNALSGAVVRDWQAHDSDVYGLKFSPDGRLLATGSSDTVAKLWDVATGRMVVLLRAHKDTVEGFDFSPDGQWLATSSWDSSVRVWGVPSGRVLYSFFGHKEGAYSVSFSPDRRTLASAAKDACLWNLATQRKVMSLPEVSQVAFAPGGKALAFFTPYTRENPYSGKLRVWRVPSFAEIEALEKARSSGARDP